MFYLSFMYYPERISLTCFKLEPFLWDIGKQYRPRSDVRIGSLIRVVTVCLQNVLLEFEFK